MKIKELARPLIKEILGDDERAEGRAEQAAFTRTWLEEQRQAGRITFHEDLEVPILDANGQSKDRKDKGDDLDSTGGGHPSTRSG